MERTRTEEHWPGGPTSTGDMALSASSNRDRCSLQGTVPSTLNYTDPWVHPHSKAGSDVPCLAARVDPLSTGVQPATLPALASLNPGGRVQCLHPTWPSKSCHQQVTRTLRRRLISCSSGSWKPRQGAGPSGAGEATRSLQTGLVLCPREPLTRALIPARATLHYAKWLPTPPHCHHDEFGGQ